MNVIGGTMFRAMIRSGAMDLQRHCDEVNSLNVFPVPDGDTGVNMLATIRGGNDAMDAVRSDSLKDCCEALRKGSLFAARGNSGVILSQFFAGLAKSLENYEQANVTQFAQAFEAGVQSAYRVVVEPVEGTILTVMREGGAYAMERIDSTTSFEDYFTFLIEKMRDSLRSTPDLLPVLKEAGVIDSGGAGLLYIVEGMGQALGGKIIEDVSLDLRSRVTDETSSSAAVFDENSTLDYGYCTEFILQLTNEKGGVESFDLNEAIAYFESIGDSLVAFRDGTLVKVHVHTKVPDQAIAYALRFGEFVRFKMDNMTLQHHQTLIDKSRNVGMVAKPETARKKYGSVIVAPTEEVKELYESVGADAVILGGKVMNPETKEFVDAAKAANAETVFLFPNNKNEVLVAQMASSILEDVKIVLIPTSNIAEGYSCLSILDFADLGFDENLSRTTHALESADSACFYEAAKDTSIDGLALNKGDYVAQSRKGFLGKGSTLMEAFEKWLRSHEGEHSLLTLFLHKDVDEETKTALADVAAGYDDFMDVQTFDSGDDLYLICATLD